MTFFALVSAGVAPAQVMDINACMTINKPGSYVLNRDLSSGSDCLTIFSSNVTIDLKGFSITGSPKAGNAVTDLGIGRQGVTVKNGRLANFAVGINLAASNAIRIENMDIADMVFDGLDGGRNAIVNNTHASNYGARGINLGDNAMVTNSSADGAGPDGGFRGFYGITVGMRALVSGSTAAGNHLVGIDADVGAQLTNNNSIGPLNHYTGQFLPTLGNGFGGILVTCPGNLVGNMTNGSIAFGGNDLSSTGCTMFNNN